MISPGSVRDGLPWAAPLLLWIHGGLQRTYAVDWDAPAKLFIATDTPPWGAGAAMGDASGPS
eukprot:9694055-Alexandrium_andersonii.AAC.1